MAKLKLTDEGRKYLKEGLPEKNLVKLLDKGPIQLSEAKRIDSFQIAFQWAKKNGWVDIKDGKLVLIKKPGNLELESALEDLDNGKQITEHLKHLLLQRRLAKEDKEDEFKRAKELVGKEIDKLTPELIKTGLWKETKIKPYNVQFTGKRIYPGKRQPYNQFLYQIRRKLVELGFKEMRGNFIELEFWNFDAMYQAQNHPSRDWTETYSLKYPKTGQLPDKRIVDNVKSAHENGWKTGSTGWGYKWNPMKAAKLMPRAHGTCLSARALANKPEIPGKYFSMARCFRPDILDATHLIEFNQTEGIVIGEDMNLRNLLGILKMFAVEVAGATKVKFLPDYYPFTEPSVQMSAKHPELGWVEFGGAGIFREEFTRPLGVDVPVLAWGIGIDRLAMFKLGIQDIRYLFSTDLKWLREEKMVV